MACAFSLTLQAVLLHAVREGPMSFQGVSHGLGCLTSCDWLCVQCRQRTAWYSYSHISTHKEANHWAASRWRPSRPGWWRTPSASTKWLREALCWQRERPQGRAEWACSQVQTSNVKSIIMEEGPDQPPCGNDSAGWRFTVLRLTWAESFPSAQTFPHWEPARSCSQRYSFSWAQPQELPEL